MARDVGGPSLSLSLPSVCQAMGNGGGGGWSCQVRWRDEGWMGCEGGRGTSSLWDAKLLLVGVCVCGWGSSLSAFFGALQFSSLQLRCMYKWRRTELERKAPGFISAMQTPLHTIH